MAQRLNSAGYDTDKDERYLHKYDEIFAPLCDREVRLLELGINTGGSLLLWRDYFRRGVIAGLDVKSVLIDDPTGRIHTYAGLQQDVLLLHRIGREIGPFDIIIDDASHIAELSRISFECLFIHHLRPGGVYVIEDWGTGYWDSWPDGHRYDDPKYQQQEPGKQRTITHDFGMVGFVKELIDECGLEDITKLGLGVQLSRQSHIDKIQVSFGQVFIFKKPAPTRSI